MKGPYVRLVTELQGKGFTVAPDPSADVPSDNSAEAFLNDALSKAEVFVHLVGDSGGFAPEGLDNIVKLQLGLARAKAAQAEGPPGQKLNRRIVWAPKILDQGGAAPAGPAVERDPLKALERFDQQIATDKIDGDILSKFVEYLFQYLTETAPKPVITAAAGNKLDLYLSYHSTDEDYAGAIAQALIESSVKPRIPVADSDADSRRYNSDLLAKCDAVTLCWGNASEVWVRSEADRLSDWQALGRKGQFAFRGLVAGPPPASHKKKNALSLIFQDGEFDKVVDLVEKGPPTAQLLVDLTSAPSAEAMSAVEISDAAAHEATPGETAPATAAAPPPADDGMRLSNERPFPGLRPFFFGDRAFFFGRERQAFALYRLVENGRFIAVIGGSGSGKSSLVLAGLQGLLADETADTGGPTWAFLDMRPGGAPITRLAGALSKLSTKDSPDETARRRDRIEWTLRQSSFSFESALAEAGGLSGRSLILVVDQFEELFRFGLAGLGYRRGGVEEARRRDEATQFVQILLDADRRRIENVRVLITMRSDFIGDCAYFHGLSEAVSATQYLVPNLTRSQLEEAIRKPIEKAGGTIEPELVERLLNDCGDELDQLPVLQHCLMRLWDRAGAETPAGGARHLTRATYDAIGRMTDALSRHADEIFDQCPGKELAIEQAFRALSEVDREGRAIRRALRFDKLLAETGVSESDLRAVLDRFRAPNCSFLLPSLSASPTLAADERIDIGHEALLRRWKKIAGKPDSVDPKTGRPPPGWLAEEQIDGQRYHTLVSLLDGTAGGERATLDDPERTKDWWGHLPRTAAWADRYGGKFEQVKKLIDDAIEAKRRSRLNRRLTARSRRRRPLAAGGTWVARERAK